MKELITIDSFKEACFNLKADHKLIEIAENLKSPVYFVKEGLEFNDIQMHRFQSLSESEKVYLLETVTESNIEKAALVLDKSHEEIIVELRASRGDITKFKHYETIESMIKDIQLSSPGNQELLKANEIIQELIKHKQTYMSAFVKDNTYRKLVYNISALCAIFTIIKEHLMFLDITSSKNEQDIVMSKESHYYATDVNNIKFLNQSLALVKSKGVDDPKFKDNYGPKTESISLLAAIKGASIAAGAAVAGWAYFTFLKLAVYAIGAIGALYIITRVSAKPMINYLESYEYIKGIAKKSRQDSDKKIVETIDKMTALKKKFINMWKNDKSKNIKDYMKDLAKDVETIKKYESKNSVHNVSGNTGHNQTDNNSYL